MDIYVHVLILYLCGASLVRSSPIVTAETLLIPNKNSELIVSWFGERSKRKVCTHQRWKHRSLMCAQVTRQVSLLGLIA